MVADHTKAWSTMLKCNQLISVSDFIFMLIYIMSVLASLSYCVLKNPDMWRDGEPENTLWHCSCILVIVRHLCNSWMPCPLLCRPYSCPCPGASCKWQGSLDEVMPHLVQMHKSITTLHGLLSCYLTYLCVCVCVVKLNERKESEEL